MKEYNGWCNVAYSLDNLIKMHTHMKDGDCFSEIVDCIASNYEIS